MTTKRLLTGIALICLCFVTGQVQSQVKAVEFSGGGNPNGAKIFVPNSQENFADFNSTTLTFELWVKFVPTGDAVLISSRTAPSGNEGFDWRLDAGWAGGRLVGGGSTLWPGLSGSVQNVWTHLALVFDGTAVTIYKNGESVFTGSLTANLTSTAGNLYIGASPMVWSEGEFFQGQMTNIRIWNVARSQSEIADNKNTIFTQSKPGLVANWTMQEGSGTVLNDVGNAAHPAEIVASDNDAQSRIAWIADSGLSLTVETVTRFENSDAESIKITRQGDNFSLSYPLSVNTITLYNVSGQQIFSHKMNGSGNFDLPLINLKKGIYFLKVDGVSETIKILK